MSRTRRDAFWGNAYMLGMVAASGGITVRFGFLCGLISVGVMLCVLAVAGSLCDAIKERQP